jgi:hypothetical protein
MLLSITDFVIQGVIVLLIFVHPWFLRPGQRSRAFCYPFLAIFFWGFWRLFYFDIVTRNDIPGIGYFIVALPYSLIALLFYAIRCAILRRRTKPNEPGNA